MRAVAQRVARARITVDGEPVGEMGAGLHALMASARSDGPEAAALLARKLVHLRIFADAEERMNASLLDTGGALGEWVAPYGPIGTLSRQGEAANALQTGASSSGRSAPREGTMHLDRSGFAVWRAGAVALGLVVALGAGSAVGEEMTSQEARSTASYGGKGVAAGLSSVVYAPVKIAYALGGSIVAGLAWVVSGGDNDVAKPIIDASVRGDYVVTPQHLTGERRLEFVGRPAADQRSGTPEVSAGAAAAQGAGDSWQ